MTAPATRTAAAELWNRMVDIGRDDGAELDRVLWQLRGHAARNPTDFLTRLGMGRAFLLRGRKEEALSHLEAAWGLRHGQSVDDLSDFTAVLLECGMLSKSLEVGLGLLALH